MDKLVTHREVEKIATSLSPEKGCNNVHPAIIAGANVVILDPNTKWYGIEVVNNQNLSVDLNKLLSDKPLRQKVYTFYFALFTNKGRAVRWDSQFTWADGGNAPDMEADKGYVYKVQVFLNSGSDSSNPLTQFLDNECLVLINPEYDFPIVYPPVSGVVITGKYNNDYQGYDETGEIPSQFPPHDHYKEIVYPAHIFRNFQYRLFLKFSANYIPTSKNIHIAFYDDNGQLNYTEKIDAATTLLELDISELAPGTYHFGYIITSSPRPPENHADGNLIMLGTIQ